MFKVRRKFLGPIKSSPCVPGPEFTIFLLELWSLAAGTVSEVLKSESLRQCPGWPLSRPHEIPGLFQ